MLTLRYRSIFLPVILGFFFLVAFAGTTALLPMQNVDAERILEFIQTQGYRSQWSGYTATAWLFSHLPGFLIQPAVLFIGGSSLIIFIWPLRTRTLLILASFITIAPIFLILTRPIKDTFVILLTMAVLFLLKSQLRPLLKVFAISLIYVFYGYLFRRYYYLIALSFFVIFIFSSGGLRVKLLLALSGLAIFIAIPDNIFMQLQGTRDLNNVLRIGTDAPGSRTIFLNPLPPTDAFNFLVNYVVAAFRLSFSFAFNLGPRELFLTFNVAIYFFLIWKGMRSDKSDARLAAHLVMAHISVLWIFDPDLGSHLRHLSSVFLYLLPIMQMLERQPQYVLQIDVQKVNAVSAQAEDGMPSESSRGNANRHDGPQNRTSAVGLSVRPKKS